MEITITASANKYPVMSRLIFYRCGYSRNMRQIFVMLAVGVPLFLAALFIVNGIISETFPMFREIPFDESQNLQQTYQAGLDH